MPALGQGRKSKRAILGIVTACFALSLQVVAQNESCSASPDPPPSIDPAPSLAAAARDAKTQKSVHSKRVFTDENVEATDGPLPRLKTDGPENSDEVIAAIRKYKLTHNAEQTEQAVRAWYEKYDQMLAAAIQDNQDTQTLRSVNASNSAEFCQEGGDYEQCRNRQMAEARSARSDQAQMTKNTQLEMRVQRGFEKVRNGLGVNNLHYDWFKIRNINGTDLY